MIKLVGITNYNFENSTIDEMLSYLKSISEIGLDTETTGFFNHNNKVICLQLGDKEIQYVISEESLIELSKNNRFIELSKTKLFLGHNLKFDYKFMLMYGIDIINMYDTQLAEMILTTGYEHKEGDLTLKNVCKKYTGVDLDKTIRGNIHKEGLSDRVIIYAAEDVEHLNNIRLAQLQQLEELDLLPVLYLENTSLRVYAKMEYYGIKLDKSNWINTSKAIRESTKTIENELDTILLNSCNTHYLKTKYVNNQLTLFDIDSRKVNINWASPAQKLVVLNDLGVKLEDTGMPTLIENSHKHPIISKLIEFSKHNKLVTSFGMDFLKFINPVTNRVHTNVWQIINSGRISMKDPNLLQIPAHGDLAGEIKKSFIAEDNYTLIDSDFSGMELRIIAELSQDPLWVETFINGGDLHSILCAKTFNIGLDEVKNPFPYKPEVNYRFVQKTVNFGLSYGMSEFKLSPTIQVPIDTAKQIINDFFAAVPKVKKFLDTIGKAGREAGRIRAPKPFRRIRWFPKHAEAVATNNTKILGEIERASKNHPIQSCNANITKLALIYIQERIDKESLDAKILLAIHDAILVEAHDSIVDYMKEVMQEEMIRAAKSVIHTIPVVVDTVTGKYWKH